MKTAEEILDETCDSLPAWSDLRKAKVIQAMHQYAEQVSEDKSVKFAEWKDRYCISDWRAEDKWICTINLQGGYTLSQLYPLFLTQQKENDGK